MASKRNYVATAARIHKINEQLAASGDLGSIAAQEAMLDLTNGLADDYERDNPRFNRPKFMAACGFAVAAENVIRPAVARRANRLYSSRYLSPAHPGIGQE